MTEKKSTNREKDQIISYYTLRVLIGSAGILLPVLLVIGKLIYNDSLEIEFSISDYYDNGLAGDILVGVLFILASFLFSYKGFEPMDDIASNLGCVFAVGVALCPTTSDNKIIHNLHFIFALLLFSVFIFFSIYLFRKSDKAEKLTIEKKYRNRIYMVCGIIMIICILGIAACMFFFEMLADTYQLVFWLESVALISFGFSWLTKSEALFLKD